MLTGPLTVSSVSVPTLVTNGCALVSKAPNMLAKSPVLACTTLEAPLEKIFPVNWMLPVWMLPLDLIKLALRFPTNTLE